MTCNPGYPSDKGFAIKPCHQCSIPNQVIQLHGTLAITMGHVDLADNVGTVKIVDQAWVFLSEKGGKIRILRDHSLLLFGAQWRSAVSSECPGRSFPADAPSVSSDDLSISGL